MKKLFTNKKKNEGSPEKKGLASKIAELFSTRGITEQVFEELEDTLIEADLGAALAMEISDELRKETRKNRLSNSEEVKALLKGKLGNYVRSYSLVPSDTDLNVILVLGVNGVGKTTSIAKLAEYFRSAQGHTPLLAAGDTFRAAAIDQLKLHGERLGVRVVAQQPGSDPGAVIFDAMESAKSRGESLLLADTAGRMHNKAHLIKELEKIHKIVHSRGMTGIYHKLLVIDTTTGQNGLRQAEIFHNAVGVDSILLAKFDSSAKGGIGITISKELGIPISFLGTGETYQSLVPFSTEEYLNRVLGG